jgi:Ca-activated chloride channel family protein
LWGQERAAAGPPIYRSDVDLLSVAVRVTDRNDNEIHGLTAGRFRLYEDGVPQKILFFAEEDEPVSLGILLDVSSSMDSNGKLDHAKEALAQLASSVRPGDEIFYLEFHRRVDKIVDFTSAPRRIFQAIAKARVRQDGTSLYDAVARALCYMRSAHHHRRALVVITDGADQNSHRSLDELIPIVQASQAQVFAIGYFDKAEYDLYRSAGNKKVTLVTSQEIDNPVMVFERLAKESGAESFFPASPSKLQAAVVAVGHQLRAQYTLAYYPKAKAGAFHRIEVKVAQSGVRVRARRGFGNVEPAPSEGPSEASAGCENEKLRPDPYESKVEIKNGCTVYHEDFRNEASGWPSKERYHYATGTYQIVGTKHEASGQSSSFSPFAPSTGPVGELGSADPAAGIVVANGPWFSDLDASVSVELKSAGGTGDLAVAAGLVFHLNDRGYYAVIVTASGSRKISFKLVKKYHFESSARDLSAWVDSPVSDLIAGSQKKIAVQCRGPVISILVQGQAVAKFEDHDFEEGPAGMVLYGTGRAIFRDLLVEEACAPGQPRHSAPSPATEPDPPRPISPRVRVPRAPDRL